MKTLVDELLTLSRLDDAQASAESAPVAMDQDVSLPRWRMRRCRVAARRRAAQCSCGRAPEQEGLSDIVVHGNARMLEEMTRNLVENAIRYNVEAGA
ncbi:MAG: hypothetical protein ACLT98_14600 [Eggerthellaceae bacterium]